MNYLLRLTPFGFQIRGMAHPHLLRHPLFRRLWFTDEVTITMGAPQEREIYVR
jgi:hypothetical protein